MKGGKQVTLCDKDYCTGCMACVQSCKLGAIHSEISEKGFAYPIIDYSRCVGCQICVKVCPIITFQAPFRFNSNSRCYSAYQKQEEVRRRSSSGGLFYTLAKYIIDQGGAVYGAAWTQNLHLKHIEADDKQALEKLLRSKYVQSDTSDVFIQVKRRLDEGRMILFCGTPCQVAAMRSFLRGRVYDNLILVDILCQGVPSPTIFRKYIDEVEMKYHTRIVDATFRSKKYGWHNGLLFMSLRGEDGRIIEMKYGKNSNYRAFLCNFFMRESCYNCQFKSSAKGCFSDITLADFWRIGDTIPYNCDSYESGVSAVLTNTYTGERFFDQIKESVVWEERSYEEFSSNGGLRVSEKPKMFNSAFDSAKTDSFDMIQEKYYPYSHRIFLSDWVSMHFSKQTINTIKKWVRRSR